MYRGDDQGTEAAREQRARAGRAAAAEGGRDAGECRAGPGATSRHRFEVQPTEMVELPGRSRLRVHPPSFPSLIRRPDEGDPPEPAIIPEPGPPSSRSPGRRAWRSRAALARSGRDVRRPAEPSAHGPQTGHRPRCRCSCSRLRRPATTAASSSDAAGAHRRGPRQGVAADAADHGMHRPRSAQLEGRGRRRLPEALDPRTGSRAAPAAARPAQRAVRRSRRSASTSSSAQYAKRLTPAEPAHDRHLRDARSRRSSR